METKGFLPDQDLIKLYVNGNEAALEQLINRYQSKLYGYLYNMVKDSELANDLFQEIFIKVINTLKSGRYNEEGKFAPWLMRIAHNLVIDYFRKSNRMKTTSGGEDFDIFSIISDSGKNAEQQIIQEQTVSKVRDLIEQLPEEQKKVVKMRLYMDMSFKEIAEETNVSINTALGRMRYALINLKKMIEERKLNLI
ncbi:MAG: sigma-70 family RNA polymerase sigma factor [Bacteroidetes bacterium]|nr:MAG: sigma-70 family RNA polymerase sigma factor [Bacteroidota bacterium]